MSVEIGGTKGLPLEKELKQLTKSLRDLENRQNYTKTEQ